MELNFLLGNFVAKLLGKPSMEPNVRFPSRLFFRIRACRRYGTVEFYELVDLDFVSGSESAFDFRYRRVQDLPDMSMRQSCQRCDGFRDILDLEHRSRLSDNAQA